MYKKLKLLLFAAILSISMTGILPLPVFNTAIFSVEAAAAPTLNKKTAILNVKQTLQLALKNNKKKVTWSSSNKKIATVSGKGLVAAKSPGTVTITANTGTSKYRCTIKINAIKVKNLKINGASSMKKDSSVQLSVTITPSNATNKTLKWSSSNGKIATVSSKGLVTGKSVGTAIITATATDGSTVKVQKKITVVPKPTPVTIRTLAPKANTCVLHAFEYLGFKLEQKSSASYSGYFTAKERKIYLKNFLGTVIYHELGHFLAWISGSRDKTAEFKAIYEKEKSKMTSANRVYNTQNSSEYFAESYREFCINPDGLKKQRPQTYNAIKASEDCLNNKSDSYLYNVRQAYERTYW